MLSFCDARQYQARVLTLREAFQRIKSSPWRCYIYKKIPVYLIMLPFLCCLLISKLLSWVLQTPFRKFQGVPSKVSSSLFSQNDIPFRECVAIVFLIDFFCLLKLTCGAKPCVWVAGSAQVSLKPSLNR